MPTDVLIAGSGPAALEAALTLHRHAPERVATTLLTPATRYTYRPLGVLSPFAAGHATGYELEGIAEDIGFTLRAGRLAHVDTAQRCVETTEGDAIRYDALLVATGARPEPPFASALTFGGGPTDDERLHGLVQDLEAGYVRDVAFAVPAGSSWPLPLYELALMLADRADDTGQAVRLSFVTPEAAPLGLFGPRAAAEVARLLEEAGVTVHAGVSPEVLGKGRIRLAPGGEVLEAQRIVTLPLLRGPYIAGLPADADGFLVTDRHGRVHGAPGVYAAGDATAFPVKQGGLACQQADAAAEAIAAAAGAAVEPRPFTPVLRGMLRTETRARFLRRDASGRAGDDSVVAGSPLWWPPTKIAGRELAGYLEGLDAQAGRGGLPVRVRMGGDAGRPVEVLSAAGER